MLRAQLFDQQKFRQIGENMAQFINTKENIVTEAVDALVAASGGKLARLDGYPHIRVVVRNDWDKSKVALISGGGSGHEPAHAGFVGKGMLTAAVCGDIFASPTVDAVLGGILSVTGSSGCLLIVKNYTGDRLNFGLAAERARAFGLNVSMVIVGDDIALPDLPQARGVAGTLFVHKIAGALAERGADLDTVTAAARHVIAGTRSIGMSLDTCRRQDQPYRRPGAADDLARHAGFLDFGLCRQCCRIGPAEDSCADRRLAGCLRGPPHCRRRLAGWPDPDHADAVQPCCDTCFPD